MLHSFERSTAVKLFLKKSVAKDGGAIETLEERPRKRPKNSLRFRVAEALRVYDLPSLLFRFLLSLAFESF